MKLIIKLFGLLILVAGLILLIEPEFIFDWIEGNKENTSLYLSAIVVRLVLGILFLIYAKESKFRGLIKFFGYIFIVAAILFILMGQNNFQEIINELISGFKPYAALSGVLAVVFGVFLIYTFTKNKNLE